jgi:threonine dehydrogenase-like Zn-dependent dehydrogenase
VWAENFGYGEYLVASEDYLYLLKEDTPFDLALGEPIACAVNGVRKLDPQLNDSICLVGCGFMGLIMLQVFQRRGVGMIVAVDTRDSVLELAGKLGATHTLNPMQTDVSNEIKELTDGKGVDIGVEASGIQQTLDLTSSLVRMEGKLEVFGYHQGGLRSVDWAYWNWMAFQIVNGHSRSAQIYVEGMKIGLEMLERNALNMKDLVTHRFALNDINKAFEMAVQKPDGFIKGVITV